MTPPMETTANQSLGFVGGIDTAIAEKGNGPLILFIHGFPELKYSWSHQILALSDLGYRTIAPDL
ncbi:hypothetical protein DVH24_022972 [Malus domestica]|uniref:AB hydrolase-1 domain-containing protein n=1 Tax=Malus domestica TaxID=3750 RepID=A0A498KM46_MALDO|nr:hypothetical protein DVH24_022972 [Malus domestica]